MRESIREREGWEGGDRWSVCILEFLVDDVEDIDFAVRLARPACNKALPYSQLSYVSYM